MSNVIKSGFVAFADDNRLVIDSNQSFQNIPAGKVIRSIDEQQEDIDDLELEDILSAEEFKDPAFEEQKAFADILIQDARSQADRLLSEARDEAARLMEQARQDGYQAGYAQGEEQARLDAQEALQTEKDALSEEYEHLKREVLAQKELFLHEAEPKMADIAARLITHLTGIVVEGQQDALVYMIDRAMRGIEDGTSFVIKVSESDFDWVMSHKEEIYGAGNPGISVEIYADAKLSANQCLIETDNGIVNCSLEEQLENLIRDIKLLSSVD